MVPFHDKYQPVQKLYLSFLVSSHRFRDIHILNFVTLKMQDKIMMDSIRSGTIRLQIPDFLSDGNSNVCIFRAFTCQNSQLESLILKMQGKIMEYSIRNGPVRWQISTCINFILDNFSLALTVFEILTFEIFDLVKSRSRSKSTTFTMMPFDSK